MKKENKTSTKSRKTVASIKKKKTAVKKAVNKTAVKKVAKKEVTKKKRVGAGKKPMIKKNITAKRVPRKKIAHKKTNTKQKKSSKSKIVTPNEIGKIKTSSFAYLITGVFELVLAMPFLGWMIGVSSFGMMWIIGIVFNIIAIIILVKHKRPIYANIIAITANVFGIVPFLGWALHTVATVLLFVLFFKEERR